MRAEGTRRDRGDDDDAERDAIRTWVLRRVRRHKNDESVTAPAVAWSPPGTQHAVAVRQGSMEQRVALVENQGQRAGCFRARDQ